MSKRLTDSSIESVTDAKVTDILGFVRASDTTDHSTGSDKKWALSAFLAATGGRLFLGRYTPSSGMIDIDLSSAPTGFKRVRMAGELASDVAAVADSLHCYFNADTTDANYYSQDNIGLNGTESHADNASPRVAAIPGANSPSSSLAWVDIVVPNHEGSNLKTALGDFNYRRDTGVQHTGQRGMSHDSLTAALTAISIRVDGWSGGDELIAGSYLDVYLEM